MNLKEIYDKLSAQFPIEAHSKDVSRGSQNPMTSIKAQFIKERLNQVLGISGWKLDGELSYHGEGKPEHSTAVFTGVLSIIADGKQINSHETFGAAPFFQRSQIYKDKKPTGEYQWRAKNFGDVIKSAQTDCLSKAASFFGVGNDVFKGYMEWQGNNLVYTGPKKTELATIEQKTILDCLLQNLKPHMDEQQLDWADSLKIDQLDTRAAQGIIIKLKKTKEDLGQ